MQSDKCAYHILEKTIKKYFNLRNFHCEKKIIESFTYNHDQLSRIFKT